MSSIKTIQAIEAIKNMQSEEADMLAIFIAGLKAGIKINISNQPRKPPENKTA